MASIAACDVEARQEVRGNTRQQTVERRAHRHDVRPGQREQGQRAGPPAARQPKPMARPASSARLESIAPLGEPAVPEVWKTATVSEESMRAGGRGGASSQSGVRRRKPVQGRLVAAVDPAFHGKRVARPDGAFEDGAVGHQGRDLAAGDDRPAAPPASAAGSGAPRRRRRGSPPGTSGSSARSLVLKMATRSPRTQVRSLRPENGSWRRPRGTDPGTRALGSGAPSRLDELRLAAHQAVGRKGQQVIEKRRQREAAVAHEAQRGESWHRRWGAGSRPQSDSTQKANSRSR